MEEPKTLLDTFLFVARNTSTVEDPVLECGAEQWTYGDLDMISSGLALDLHNKCGPKPVVAVISENHPFVLAILLATWKLGGIFAPFDCHSPLEMVKKMLENTEASCAVIPDFEEGLNGLIDKAKIPKISYSKNTTITSLTQQYLDQAADISPSLFPLPDLSSLAAYIHTSSASSISNLKCVQLTHESIAKGCRSVIKWFHRSWPSVNFDKLRVLGIAPWSHIMALSYDFGAATFGTGGCYVFGVPPSGYPVEVEDGGVSTGVSGKAEEERDVLDRLVDVAVTTRPDVLVAVPWVLEGFKERYTRLLDANKEVEALRVKNALQKLKCLGSGGAAMSSEMLAWIKDMKINASSNIGMTELGGGLFHRKIDLLGGPEEDEGWSLEDCFLEDVKLVMLDEDDNENAHEGELYITSRDISRGYLKYDNSAFNLWPNGSVTFKTGDIYEKRADGRYVWKGRKDDYIQTASGETLDPRPVEKALNACPAIAHCCVVGNNFIRKASDVIYVLIQPALDGSSDGAKLSRKQTAQITSALAAVNRTLLPPLRIPWSRVRILDNGMTIPYTRKGMIFRKKLEMLFGDLVARVLEKNNDSQIGADAIGVNQAGQGQREMAQPAQAVSFEQPVWKKERVEQLIVDTIASILGIGKDDLLADPNMTFAEFGLDSNMAVRIVNELNSRFTLHLPLNACHSLIDLRMMSEEILVELGIRERPPHSKPRETSNTTKTQNEVVIVGQALRLPGEINTPEAFWEALANQRDDIMSPVPSDRWDHASFYRSPASSDSALVGDINFEKAGFVDVAHFDNAFFGVSAPEAIFISPSVRLTLETAFEALENACIPISQVKGTNMGAFVAAGLNEGYTHVLFGSLGWDTYKRNFGTGTASSTACGRLSYLLDIHGPSMTIDTACSSGMVAFHEAVNYIQSGEGESALVAAASTALWPGSFGFLTANKMASPNSRCATFTDKADGYVPSEGCVSFVLKSRLAAIRDGDNILAVVKSTGVMHGGKSQGLVSPNVNTQIALQKSLLRKAGLQPSDIDFLETHGTGTSLGDLIEIQGINEVFKLSHLADKPLILSASKSCVGHTEMASGLVGLLSVIASFKHKIIPGLVHLNEYNLNPSINCGIVPLQIPHQPTPLPPKGKAQNVPYRGLVLSNGFAGTLAGTIVEGPEVFFDYPLRLNHAANGDCIPMPFVVSAKNARGLEAYLQRYLDFCRKLPATDFADLCFTTCTGREHYRYRFACVAYDLSELIDKLEKRLRVLDSDKLSRAPSAPRLVFAFPGQGSHFQGMASDLADCYSDFKDIITAISAKASQFSGHQILPFLLEKDPIHKLSADEGQMAQICIFVFQYSLALWLRNLGVEPSAVLGHSLGEITAAAIAGAMSFEFALEFVIKRAEILCSGPGPPAGMAIVAANKETILRHIHDLGFDGRIVIAVFNGPESHVVSGDLLAINSLLAAVKDQGMRGARLNVTQGFHSPSIEPCLPALQAWLTNHQPEFSPLELPLYSTVYGSKFSTDTRLPSSYWIEHARNAVQFSRALEELDGSKDINIVLDIGPQPFIWTTMQALQHHKTSIATSTKPTSSQSLAFLRGLALLFESGVTLDFGKLLKGSRLEARKISIPTYPFQRQRHYPKHIPSRYQGRKALALEKDDLRNTGRTISLPVDRTLFNLLADHLIQGQRVVPGAYLVDFFASYAPFGAVQSISFHSPLVLEPDSTAVRGEIDQDGRFRLYESDSEKRKVCSGIFGGKVAPVLRDIVKSQPPEQVKTTAEVYANFKNVQFGPSFRNVQEIKTWSTHAEAFITVQSTASFSLDRMRKLDACLHAFGAIISKEVPQVGQLDGAFLPSSLEGFTLYCDHLPESFLCRYHLPVDVARNFHVISAAFDVLSQSGELLVSCRKYSVAWVPSSLTILKKSDMDSGASSRAATSQWLRQSWVQRDIDAHSGDGVGGLAKYDQLLVVSSACRTSRIASMLPAFSHESTMLYLPAAPSDLSLEVQFEGVIRHFSGTRKLIVLDLTSVDALPMTETFTSCHRHVLRLMQLLSHYKVDIQNFVVISEMSVPMDIDNGAGSSGMQAPSVASLVQGMIRVFRRETGFDREIWALDLPSLNVLDDQTLQDLLVRELEGRQKGMDDERTVALRRSEHHGRLERFVPVLKTIRTTERSATSYSRPAVIIGLGSIGASLAQPLISKGIPKVIFIGRRSADNAEVQNIMHQLDSDSPGKVWYIQADVCDPSSLRKAISDIQATHGAIGTIVHSAAVISDATIQNVGHEIFEAVIHPKVLGAWNLHTLSEELCPTLEKFVLLSSVSVSLGNPGQIAYVAGNHYMEVLASYRRSKNLPATALQLGPWESKLTKNLDNQDSLIPLMVKERGIPLIFDAISRSDLVQMIANLDIERLAAHPVYSRDSLFRDIVIASAPANPPVREERSEDELSNLITDILRTVLELEPSDKLELGDPLTLCGVDSISFAQVRGRILHELKVEVPMMFLSDTFTIHEMIAFVVEKYSSKAT